MIPPLDFLLEVSLKTLEDLELASRNQAANLSKTLRRELEAWVELEATAMVARWMVEHREELMRRVLAEPKSVDFLQLQKAKKSA